MQARRTLRIDSLRPLVRYVDESQAIVELRIGFLHPLPLTDAAETRPARQVDLLVHIDMPDGFIDEHRVTAEVVGMQSTVRFTIVEPMRWWPAGMGDQALYELRVHVLDRGEACDAVSTTIGLTSIRRPSPTIRPATRRSRRKVAPFVVNGRPFGVQAVLPVDAIHENRLLPASSDMMLMIRGHYGPDLLYNAADRAGLLLLQCVPIDPDGEPDARVAEHVDRLSHHPCLVGWVVGHLGRLADRTSQQLRQLDPTRPVFQTAPTPS